MNLETHFATLLELLVKSAALTLAGLALLASIRKSSAANRHAVVAVLFGALLLLPLTRLVTPLWSFALESAEPEPVVTVRLPSATPARKKVELAVAPTVENADPVATPAPVPHTSLAIPRQALAVVAWLAGAALLLARRAVIAVQLRSVLRQSRALENERLARLVRESVNAAGVHAEVRISIRCRVPLAAGVVRPVILLPVEAEGWSDALVSSALRHELGHIRRRDCVVRLLADIACALHWLNPLAWLAARRLRLAQEQACDDLVLNSGASADEYAGQLVDVVRSMQRDRLVARHALAMAQPSTIETRVIAIMDASRNRSPRIVRGVIGGAAFAAAMLAICAAAQVGGANEDKAADALKRGLAFLAARQNADGSFGKENLQGSIGLTSLAGLALMPDRSHAGAVERALKFVLQSQQPDGYFHAQRGSMYDHGYATLFIAEALRTGNSPDTREWLLKAVAVIQKSQGPHGGWRYQPQPADGDSSVSSCQVMALAAVRNAGVDVPADVIKKAVGYLKKCQNADGGFQYVLGGGGGGSAFPRSAAALAATMATREIADIGIQPDVAKAAAYVGQFLPKAGDPREQAGFFIHGLYYAEQANRSVPGDRAKHSREALREFLLTSQQADGSWADKMSTDLATSQACLILQAGQAARPGGAKSKTGGAAPARAAQAANAPQVEIEAKFIEITGEDPSLPDFLKAPEPKAGAKVPHILAAENADIVGKALNARKGVDLLSSPRVTARSKQNAKIEIIREFRHATAWEKDSKSGEWKPTIFDTKNLGVTFDVTPEVNADGTIDLAMTPEVVEFAGFKDLDGDATKIFGKPDTGKPLSERLTEGPASIGIPEGHRAQALFNTRKVSTNVNVSSGMTVVLGGMERGGAAAGGKQPQRRLVVLVTARIVEPAGAPLEEPAGVPGNPKGKAGAVKEPKSLEIVSDKMSLDKKTGTLSASGNVRIETAQAVIKAASAEITPKKDAANAGDAKADAQWILPKVNFRDATLREVVEFLVIKSRTLDAAGKGVNIVLRNMEKIGDVKITLSLTDVPLAEVLRYVATLANCEVVKEEFAFVISPMPAAKAPAPNADQEKGGANAPTAPAPGQPEGAALKKARAIIFPKVDLQDATLSETVDFLREKSKALDPDKQGVNIILKPAAGEPPRLTLSLSNVPLTEIIKYVAALAGYEFVADDHAITIRPAAK